jgi:circadian clock protein KaiB
VEDTPGDRDLLREHLSICRDPGRVARVRRRATALDERDLIKSRKERTEMRHYILKLYITGRTPNSERAIDNLRRLCEEDLGGKYEMVVVDILEKPQLAEDERILATPTLVKELPPPLTRIIGDLSDREKVLLGLDLRPMTPHGGKEGSS